MQGAYVQVVETAWRPAPAEVARALAALLFAPLDDAEQTPAGLAPLTLSEAPVRGASARKPPVSVIGAA